MVAKKTLNKEVCALTSFCQYAYQRFPTYSGFSTIAPYSQDWKRKSIPWVQHNCPIPPELENEVCEIICNKIKAGIYEPLNSAYCSCWFCVLKKNGKLRIVHSLELLNCVTIHHSGVPPFTDHVTEFFAGHICSAMLDLYNWIQQQIVTNNGAPILKAITYLAKKYNLHHIWVSGYNKCANSFVKQPHFDICQALFKAVDSDQSRSECVTVCKQMGCFSYYAMTGTHPFLPADIVEVTYLQLLTNSFLSSTNLITLHNNVLSACCLAAICFEVEDTAMICNYNFQIGNLLLRRITRIEVPHNKKMRIQYLGLLVIISYNCGGTYMLCKLDGSVLHHPIAAFHLVPYFA
ncbi:hypothetical protein J132_03979 [Termitomyces sp. J132]|nr:hypothetical protein J132_03979 [Termitomyces sp. J132]